MVHLVKIGNSQGIRIPKPIIEQAQLVGKELKLEVVKEGLLIAPKRAPREGWEQAINKALETHGTEIVDNDWLDANLTMDEDLEW